MGNPILRRIGFIRTVGMVALVNKGKLGFGGINENTPLVTMEEVVLQDPS